MLALPNVTLVFYECAAHKLAARAIEDILNRVTFAEVRIYSDIDLKVPRTKWLKIDAVPRNELHKHVQSVVNVDTSHFLFAQWDSGIVDANMWSDEFLLYDYIGAPWPWHKDDYQVGCGGFSLWSSRFWKFGQTNTDRFPDMYSDNILCRIYRPVLENEGFVWAPLYIAEKFAFERGPVSKTFGYHGMFNMPHVLDQDTMLDRIRLANDYVRKKVEWHEMLHVLTNSYA